MIKTAPHGYLSVSELASSALTSMVIAALSTVSFAQEPRGAPVAFTTYEAESLANAVQGMTVAMTSLPAQETSTPELEASGRAYAQLTAPGDFLEFSNVRAANTIVLRHCIPDAPNGGGLSSTLSLYVNDAFRQRLTLSSRHNWLYGAPDRNGQAEEPSAGQPHVFWDESRFFIEGEVRQGDRIRLQKDPGDTAQYYRVDLMDLETAPGPLAPPAAGTYLSVADFGANGSDSADDSTAIQKCIDAAKAARKSVWLPAGTYFQNTRFNLDGVAVSGAGMWHTQIVGATQGTTGGATFGFTLGGDGPAVRDLAMNAAFQTHRSRTGARPFNGAPTNWKLENLWITHSQTGMWIRGQNGVVRGVRIRMTYADGINLNRGSSHNLVEGNHIRGIGDDGIALLSELEFKDPPSSNNVIRFNTVSAVWWGHNCDIAGGSGNVVEDNVFADNAKMGVFTLNLPTPFPMHPITGAVIRRNSFVRGGGNTGNQKRGAVWIFSGSTTVSNVQFVDNSIMDPIFRGIHLAGSKSQSTVFERNTIRNPGEDGIVINREVTGSGVFSANVVTQLPPDGRALVNKAGGDYRLSETAAVSTNASPQSVTQK